MHNLKQLYRTKLIPVLFLFLAGTGFQYSYSQTNNIEINIYRPKKSFSSHIKFEVYFNERPIGALENDSKITCSLFSAGKIEIKLIGYTAGSRSTDLDIFRRIYTSSGETRFFRLVQDEIWMLKDIEAYSAGTEFNSIKNATSYTESLENPLIEIVADDTREIEQAPQESSDTSPPVISLLNPPTQQGQTYQSSDNQLQLFGKVEDQSGIFEVQVNGNPAVVNADGTFTYRFLLAFGDNNVYITAKDINLNTSSYYFIVNRKSAETESDIALTKPLIIWQNPVQESSSSTESKFNLRACVKSSEAINAYKIYVNNSLKINTDYSQKQFRNLDCDLQLDEQITLNSGTNNIKLEIITASGSEAQNRTIELTVIEGRYFGLIIGVEDYDDPEINDLLKPIDDAQRLYDVLVNKYSFTEERMIFLKNPTKEKIIGTLHSLRNTITKSDNLLIYFAGHGYWDEGMNTGYWLPSDSRKDNPVNWLPNPILTGYIQAIPARHTLLIADACFSGGIFRTRSAFSNAPAAIEKLYQLPSRKAMTSGTLKEVPDESVFLDYLIRRLDSNTEKYITSEQLFSSLRTAVINNSPNIPQYGEIKNTGDEGGDFIFILSD